ncbi:hypothetical protein D9M69_728550 [compost metagenome]
MLAPFKFEKTTFTFDNSSPAFSMARIVFSKVGASGLLAMVLISASCLLIPSKMAGLKCSFFILSKGGTSNGVA